MRTQPLLASGMIGLAVGLGNPRGVSTDVQLKKVPIGVAKVDSIFG